MISVVIPVVDRRSSLERAARSAAGQVGIAGEEVELIVVDDGSRAPVEAAWLPDRARVVRIETNSGPAAARNAGVAAARGDLIAFLDSDDVWQPDKLALQLARLGDIDASAAAKTAIVCGFYYFNNRNGRVEARVPRASAEPVDFAGGCWFCPGSTLLMSREIFEVVGGFDESLRRLEDVDWFLRFALAGGRVSVAPALSAVIRPSGSVGMAQLREPLARLEQKYLLDPASPLRLEGAMRRTLAAYCALERCASSLVDGRKLRALVHLARSIALSPRLQPALRPYWTVGEVAAAEIRRLTREIESTHRAATRQA